MSMGSGLQADQRAVAPVAAWGRRERRWGPRFSKLIATRGQGRMKEKKLRGQLISNKKEKLTWKIVTEHGLYHVQVMGGAVTSEGRNNE